MRKGVTFRYSTDVTQNPTLLAPFDRIVIATGAAYRFGPRAAGAPDADWGAARWPGFGRMFSERDGARLVLLPRPHGRPATAFKALAKPGQTVIGDRRRAAGRQEQGSAIASAFEAALLGAPAGRSTDK